jgi:uncharacterized secreted protein with C-terminal beta-propeller domain
MRKLTTPLVLAAVLLAALLAATGSDPAAANATSTGANGARLQSFGTCDRLLGYAKQHTLPLVGPWGLGGQALPVDGVTAVAAPVAGDSRSSGSAGVDYSTTNVQEDGVDEPDLVKSNGSHLLVVRSSQVFAVDVRGRRPALAGSLQLPPGAGYELLLHGDRLLALSHGGGIAIGAPQGGVRRSLPFRPSQASLIEIDVSNPAALRIVRSLVLDGDYVSARLVGAAARVVTVSSMPQPLPFTAPAGPTPKEAAAALTRNRAVVRTSSIRKWLPSYAVKGRRGETLSRRSLVRCDDVLRPATYSGLGLLTVLTIDLDKGLALVDSDSVVADGRTVYASRESLYVATQRWFAQPVAAGAADPPETTTAIHKFDISSPVTTSYRGSGTVPGYLMSQWSLSEYRGVLRVASTEEPTWWNPGPREQSASLVTTLGEQAGALVRLGQVGGLGKGERVYAVRFIGDTGYVVTFRQVDPLYTLDLSAPAQPRVLGELKLLGYSAYLHPLGDGLLLGIGQDATEEGRALGTQLSLFDVSDLRRPVRLQARALGSSWSEAESDHHAFLWWGPSRLAVLPVQAYTEKPFFGAIGFRVGRGGIDEAGRVTHAGESGSPSADRIGGIPIRRSLVVGDSLYTVSDSGIKATGLATFADNGWAAFPESPPADAPSR